MSVVKAFLFIPVTLFVFVFPLSFFSIRLPPPMGPNLAPTTPMVLKARALTPVSGLRVCPPPAPVPHAHVTERAMEVAGRGGGARWDLLGALVLKMAGGGGG